MLAFGHLAELSTPTEVGGNRFAFMSSFCPIGVLWLSKIDRDPKFLVTYTGLLFNAGPLRDRPVGPKHARTERRKARDQK